MAETITTSTTPSASEPRHDHFVKHANLMSVLTIVSRVFGLIRDKACAIYLGNKTTEWSAFWMGFQLPNLFRRIFGEGALTAIFVPIYTEMLHKQGEEAARKLAARTGTLLVTFLGVLTVVGEFFLVPMALRPDIAPNNRLAAAMIAVMLPYCVLICLTAFMSAIATVHEKFAAQSITPIILNVCMTLAAAVPVWLWSVKYPLQQRIYWVAASVLVAGVIQVVLMMASLRRAKAPLGVLFGLRDPGIRQVISAMLPMMLGLSAVQLNTYMDTQIAWWFSPDGHNDAAQMNVLGHIVPLPLQAHAVGILSVAQRLYMLPVGIFGVSMATAIFPRMAKAATHKDMAELKRLLVAGLRKTLFLSLPASIGMMLVARPLIAVIYTTDGIERAAWAAAWFCGGIWAFEAQMVILRAYYALSDRITPMKVAVGMVVLNFSLNLTLIWFLQEGGIALATTISAIVQSFILLVILRQRVGRLGLRGLRSSILKGLLACAAMTAAALAVMGGLEHVTMPVGHTGQVLWIALVYLPAVIGSAAVVYGGAAWLLEMPELGDLPVVGRFFKKR